MFAGEYPDLELQSYKADLAVKVAELIIAENLVHTSLVLKEVDWFFYNMGIEDSYFASTPAADIAMHISAIYAEKILAKAGNADEKFSHSQEAADRAFFFTKSLPTSLHNNVFALEAMIEASYLHEGYTGSTKAKTDIPFRLKVFRSSGAIGPDMDFQLRFYLLHRPKYPENSSNADLSKENRFSVIADADFMKRSSANTKRIYQDLIVKVIAQPYAVLFDSKVQSGENEHRICLAYRQGTTHSVMSFFTDLYHGLRLFSTKKFVEQFANGITIISVYLKPTEECDGGVCESSEFLKRIEKIKEGLYTLLVLPRTSLTPLFREHMLNAGEVSYAYCAWKFAHQFLSKYELEYSALHKSLEKHDPRSLGYLLKLRTNLRKDTFTENKVVESMKRYIPFLKLLFEDLEDRFGPSRRRALSDSRGEHDFRYKQLREKLETIANSEFDLIVLNAFLTFNQFILKTNFFKKDKSALSFRLDPSFLSKEEYPITPFAVFFVIGSEFRGFHVRFRDVARGGIRLIVPKDTEMFSRYVGELFDENYNLASTQQRKNKDIPEGGSKGTILLSVAHRDKGPIAFRKYVDALLDLLLPFESEIVDLYQKEEILFLGPDEGTADFMDWASNHARKRGAGFWKGFTTGKSMKMGGIPHDTFGMTTLGVREYVKGVHEKLGWVESQVTKFQTGGPDGDLGSNEILMSSEKTIAIVDGSGVLYDPTGIHKEELVRLAKARKMVREFDCSFLSSDGFLVDIDDREVTLPNGHIVPNGLLFRNTFHLSPLSTADVFVPCGGRPESIDINNVSQILDAQNKPRFKVIVEGANLFITQSARLFLEEHGVILYKDASANKGGVTSSSLEVLAALALSDDEFSKHMQVTDVSNPPAFYSKYVRQVQAIIARNSRMEFECIWRENEASGTPCSVISDLLSNKINALSDSLVASSLCGDKKLCQKVVKAHCPSILIETIGLEALFERVPDSYLKAIFGSQLASSFVYQYGIHNSEFAFFDFMSKYRND